MQFNAKSIINEQYQLIQRIGSGGFSVVWLAESIASKKQYAIKIYSPQQGLDPSDILLFEEEYHRLKLLEHSNIIKTYDYFKVGDSPCLVLDYCEKGSLSAIIKRGERLTEKEVARLMTQIGGALTYLHNLPTKIYHLDIKPDNILIDSHGNYILTDFGISNEIRNTMLRSSRLKGETLTYRSPERIMNYSLSDKHDVFSFGVVLLECCRGLLDTQFFLAENVIKGYPLPEITSYKYSRELEQLLHAIYRYNPDNRPSSKQISEIGMFYIQESVWQLTEDIKEVETTRTTQRLKPQSHIVVTQGQDVPKTGQLIAVLILIILVLGTIVYSTKMLLDNEKTLQEQLEDSEKKVKQLQ